MLKNGRLKGQPRSTRCKAGIVVATVSFGMAGALAFASPSSASPAPYSNPNFSPESAQNSYTGEDPLNAACPNGIADTPGSFPAAKELVSGDFNPGGVVHYVYHDNPNVDDPKFVLADCVVTYPADKFTASQFTDHALTDDTVTKQDLDKDATQIDGIEMTGTIQTTGDIFYQWQSPADVGAGLWVCNFARDTAPGHGGAGNRKALPICYQVPAAATTTTSSTTTSSTTSSTTTSTTSTSTTTTSTTAPPTTTTTARQQTPPPPPPDNPTTTTTEAPTTTTTSLPELPFTPEPEAVTTTTMAPAPELAFTGSDSGYLTTMGLVLVGFGGLLFAGSNRKRRTTN